MIYKIYDEAARCEFTSDVFNSYDEAYENLYNILFEELKADDYLIDSYKERFLKENHLDDFDETNIKDFNDFLEKEILQHMRSDFSIVSFNENFEYVKTFEI